MKIPFSLIFLGAMLALRVTAQSPETLKIRDYVHNNAGNIIGEYTAFLSLPNTNSSYDSLYRNAELIRKMMIRKGIQNIQFLKTDSPGIPPVVYGEVLTPGASETFIFYAHYDGQPVNNAEWTNGLSPFQPVLYSETIEKGGHPVSYPSDNKFSGNWRIYARSAADDKVGVEAVLNAYDAINKTGLKPGCNIKFFFEGEEESGSSHLGEILGKYQSLLQSDLWIICDGPVHQSEKKQIFLGVRGISGMNLTLYASKKPLHSGHYGNWAPNPAMMMAKLLASMKSEDGTVLIQGFYDDVIPLSPSELQAIKDVPSVDEMMMKELGIASTEMKGLSLIEAINQPSLNINGLQSGNVGKMASNQIPSVARASLDLRLVAGNDWKRQQKKVIDHIKNQGYYIIDREPTDDERNHHDKIISVTSNNLGYNAQRTPLDLPISKKVIHAINTTIKDPLIVQPTMGASLPLYIIETTLHAKIICVPVANHDNNQHAANENIRLQNLFDGIETIASVMLIQ